MSIKHRFDPLLSSQLNYLTGCHSALLGGECNTQNVKLALDNLPFAAQFGVWSQELIN